MGEEYREALNEIRTMLKMLTERQEQIIESINEMKETQKKLREEIRFSNFVLNSINLRNEIMN